MKPRSERNLDGYGTPAILWDKVEAVISSNATQEPESGGPDRHTSWLATVNGDGTPHVMPLGAMWIEGAYYFTSGPGTRKSQNLATNPHCVITLATHDFDLVIEGEATQVTNEQELSRAAEVFASGGWTPEVRDGAFYAEFSAPSAGPPPWYVYRVKPKRIYAMGAAEPWGATRWDF